MGAQPPLHRLDLDVALLVRSWRGIETYRGGYPAAPFVGDAAAEAFDGTLDLAIYAEEMERQGAPVALARAVADLARAAARLLAEHLRARERLDLRG